MKAFTRILAAFWISASLLLGGCSINRADSLRMLDKRAEYDQPGISNLPPDLRERGLEGFENAPVPVRTRGQVAAVYAFRTEMSPTVYFWGAWFSLVIEEPQWVLSKPGTLPPAPGIANAAKLKAGKKKRPLAAKKVAAPSPPSVNAPALN